MNKLPWSLSTSYNMRFNMYEPPKPQTPFIIVYDDTDDWMTDEEADDVLAAADLLYQDWETTAELARLDALEEQVRNSDYKEAASMLDQIFNNKS